VGVWAVACGGSLPHPPYIQQPEAALVPVPAEPPPARVEDVPARPDVKGAVWIDGEWSLQRGRWAWTLGRWVVTPRGASYSPWVFVRRADGALQFAPGAFWDADGKPVRPPVPIVEAKAGSGAVIDPEGVTDTTGRTRRATMATDMLAKGEEDGGAPHPAKAPDVDASALDGASK